MKVRIVTDKWSGYEVQLKRWWWPIWWQAPIKYGSCNTHASIEQAEYFIKNKLWERDKKFISKVVETLEVE